MRNPNAATPLLMLTGLLLGPLDAVYGDDAPPPVARLNVLLVIVDDLRTSLGCYGDRIVKSPNIDRLAETSRLFRRAYCHQAVCGPSRASILTGLLPDNTGVWHNRNLFRETHTDLVTLPQLFKNNGYFAQGLGKIFSGDKREEDPQSWSVPTVLRAPDWRNYVLPENQGQGKQLPLEFADVPDDGYPDGKLADLAIETLQRISGQPKPFFLAVGFFKPHLPFTAPKKYWDLYNPAMFQAIATLPRPRGTPAVAYPDHLELAGYRGIPDDERVSADESRDLRQAYYACISYTDAQVGRLLGELSRLGLDERTIVVLLGDHGYSLGEAEHWCKDTNFELDTHVPLMIRTPGMMQPGTPSDALVEYVDIFPTLAALAQLTPAGSLDGRSLTPNLDDPTSAGRDVVLSQFSRPFAAGIPEIMGYSVRTRTLRYTRWIEWTTHKVLSEELYDYSNSASATQFAEFLIERENLADDPAQAAVQGHLSNMLDDLIATRLHPVTPEVAGRKSKRNKRKP